MMIKKKIIIILFITVPFLYHYTSLSMRQAVRGVKQVGTTLPKKPPIPPRTPIPTEEPYRPQQGTFSPTAPIDRPTAVPVQHIQSPHTTKAEREDLKPLPKKNYSLEIKQKTIADEYNKTPELHDAGYESAFISDKAISELIHFIKDKNPDVSELFQHATHEITNEKDTVIARLEKIPSGGFYIQLPRTNEIKPTLYQIFGTGEKPHINFLNADQFPFEKVISTTRKTSGDLLIKDVEKLFKPLLENTATKKAERLKAKQLEAEQQEAAAKELAAKNALLEKIEEIKKQTDLETEKKEQERIAQIEKIEQELIAEHTLEYEQLLKNIEAQEKKEMELLFTQETEKLQQELADIQQERQLTEAENQQKLTELQEQTERIIQNLAKEREQKRAEITKKYNEQLALEQQAATQKLQQEQAQRDLITQEQQQEQMKTTAQKESEIATLETEYKELTKQQEEKKINREELIKQQEQENIAEQQRIQEEETELEAQKEQSTTLQKEHEEQKTESQLAYEKESNILAQEKLDLDAQQQLKTEQLNQRKEKEIAARDQRYLQEEAKIASQFKEEAEKLREQQKLAKAEHEQQLVKQKKEEAFIEQLIQDAQTQGKAEQEESATKLQKLRLKEIESQLAYEKKLDSLLQQQKAVETEQEMKTKQLTQQKQKEDAARAQKYLKEETRLDSQFKAEQEELAQKQELAKIEQAALEAQQKIDQQKQELMQRKAAEQEIQKQQKLEKEKLKEEIIIPEKDMPKEKIEDGGDGSDDEKIKIEPGIPPENLPLEKVQKTGPEKPFLPPLPPLETIKISPETIPVITLPTPQTQPAATTPEHITETSTIPSIETPPEYQEIFPSNKKIESPSFSAPSSSPKYQISSPETETITTQRQGFKPWQHEKYKSDTNKLSALVGAHIPGLKSKGSKYTPRKNSLNMPSHNNSNIEPIDRNYSEIYVPSTGKPQRKISLTSIEPEEKSILPSKPLIATEKKKEEQIVHSKPQVKNKPLKPISTELPKVETISWFDKIWDIIVLFMQKIKTIFNQKT